MQAPSGSAPPTLGDLAAHPHDALFRALMNDVRLADALIRDHLPDAIRNQLTGALARPGITGQVDVDLRQSFLDAVFEFGGLPGRPALVVPVEHKQTLGPDVLEQLVAYFVRVRRQYREAGSRPTILSMLVSIGHAPARAPWTTTRGPDGLSELREGRLRLECLWLDVAKTRYELLSSAPAARAVLGALRCAHVRPAPMDTLRKVFRDLAVLPRDALLWRVTFCYGAFMFCLEKDEYWALVREADPAVSEAEMATMYNDAMNEVLAVGERRGEKRGERRGEKRGRVEGQADLLLQQMRRRFGPVPTDIEALVRAAPATRLEAWGCEIFDAANLEDLLRNGRNN